MRAILTGIFGLALGLWCVLDPARPWILWVGIVQLVMAGFSFGLAFAGALIDRYLPERRP